MKKAATNHHKPHKPRQWRTDAQSPRAGGPRSAFRHGLAACVVRHGGAAAGRRRGRGRDFPRLRESLNWTLRRYVRALSLRVWLRRQTPEAGGAPGSVGRAGVLGAAARLPGTAGDGGPPARAWRPSGVSLSMDRALRYRIHRNRQMEHLTQLAASLRGGVRRGATITPREHFAALDLLSTTLSNNACV